MSMPDREEIRKQVIIGLYWREVWRLYDLCKYRYPSEPTDEECIAADKRLESSIKDEEWRW